MPDQPLDLAFPTGGIDITTEYELQPAGTTPVAINVRGIEPVTQRNRGGSRSGLSRYVNDRPGGLSSLIQHLNIIVDPTVAATGGQAESDATSPIDHGGDGTGVIDPSNNPDPGNPRNPGDRYIRRGSSGGGSGNIIRKGVRTKFLATAVDDSIQMSVGDPATDVDVLANDTYSGVPNIAILSGPDAGTASVVNSGAASRIRYKPPATGDYASDSLRYRLRATGNSLGNDNVQFAQNIATLNVDLSGGWTFIQQKTTPYAVLDPSGTASFNLPIAIGNLLVCVVVTFGDDVTLTVRSADAVDYLQAGAYQKYAEFGVTTKISMWYKIATGAAVDDVVTITPSGSCSGASGLLEYHNTAAVTLDGTNGKAEGILFPSAWTTNQINVTGTKELVVAAFATSLSDETGNFTFDFCTLRCNQPDGTGGLTDCVLFVGDILDEDLSTPQTAVDIGGNHYLGIGASFKA